jgi:hypothetical protein
MNASSNNDGATRCSSPTRSTDAGGKGSDPPTRTGGGCSPGSSASTGVAGRSPQRLSRRALHYRGLVLSAACALAGYLRKKGTGGKRDAKSAIVIVLPRKLRERNRDLVLAVDLYLTAYADCVRAEGARAKRRQRLEQEQMTLALG